MTGIPQLPKSAQQALAKVGVTHLEQLAEMTELQIGRLRGIGTVARRQLHEALAASGMSFAVAKKQKPAKEE
jgi:NAD-dependent DNA ligase